MSVISQIENAVRQLQQAEKELRALRDAEPVGSQLWRALDAIEDRLFDARIILETP